MEDVYSGTYADASYAEKDMSVDLEDACAGTDAHSLNAVKDMSAALGNVCAGAHVSSDVGLGGNAVRVDVSASRKDVCAFV